MNEHEVVSHEDWVKAREAFLETEKQFTRMRDELSEARRRLPWEKIDKHYLFDTSGGKRSLADLFDGRSQLIVYHFMYGPDWDEGCKSCSFLADHFDPAVVHLNHRDVSLVAVSRAPLAVLEAFKHRMGWRFPWVSSAASDFNQDFQVSFTQEQVDSGNVYYNYRHQDFPSTEAPGASVFYRNASGEVFHTYSAYQRGLDMFLTAYHYLDVVPKGRDEARFSYTMEWIRLHDAYDE